MATPGWCMSSRDLIVRYLRERGRLTALVPLSVLMAATGLASRDSARSTATGFALAALMAFVLLLAFRVWDDVEDRAYDADHHPTRITVIARSVRPLRGFGSALMTVGAMLIATTHSAPPRLCVLGVCAAVLAVWYRSRSPSRRGLANSHVVLLKYPALAFATAPVSPSLTALGALYVG